MRHAKSRRYAWPHFTGNLQTSLNGKVGGNGVQWGTNQCGILQRQGLREEDEPHTNMIVNRVSCREEAVWAYLGGFIESSTAVFSNIAPWRSDQDNGTSSGNKAMFPASYNLSC